MSRAVVRLVALLVVTAIALGAGFGAATAAEGDYSRVPKSKLTQKPFRGITLVAIGDRVYVTLGYGQPVAALDAATGETIRQYDGTEGTQEFVFHDGRLYAAIGDRFGLVRILRLGIVLLGIRLSIGEAGAIGAKALPIIIGR